MLRVIGLSLVLVLAGALPVAAQNGERVPPPRAGRISAIDGRMTYRNPDDQDWSEAALNYPVAPGMEIATAPGARAELDLGGTALRLDGRTALAVLALDEDATVVRLDDGSLAVRIEILFDNERVAVETPDGRVDFTAPGSYRIDAGVGTAPSRVVAFTGRAEIASSRGRQSVDAGTAFEVNDEGRVRPAPVEMISIDEWSQLRDADRAAGLANRFVSDGVPGAADLDRYGSWQQTVDYGAVWYPRSVPIDWAPYAYGSWMWAAPWGWTWVDAQPWGFAPFHYGRWVYVGGRWGWCPGERLRRPIYAPAVVGFVGNDPWRFASRRDRPSHWVPLAPGELYRPPYARDPDYLRRLNRGSVRGDRVDIVLGGQPDFTHRRLFDGDGGRFVGGGRREGPGRGPIVITDPPRPIPPGTRPDRDGGRDGGRGDGGRGDGDDGRRHWPGTPPPNTPGDRGGQTPNPVVPPAPPAGVPGDGRWPRGSQTPPTQMPPANADPNATLPLRQPHLDDRSPESRLHPERVRPGNVGQGNVGRGNLGQGNLGQGNAGQGNAGDPNVGQAPGGRGPFGGGPGRRGQQEN
jgi:hypothetical protein